MNHKTLSEGLPMICGAVYGFISPAQLSADAGKTVICAAIAWGTGRLLNMAAARYSKWRDEKDKKA